jgi:hypothetical protein
MTASPISHILAGSLAEGHHAYQRPGLGKHGVRLPAIFADLVARNVDVMAVAGRIGRTSLAQEAHRATRTIRSSWRLGPPTPSRKGSWRDSPVLVGT